LPTRGRLDVQAPAWLTVDARRGPGRRPAGEPAPWYTASPRQAGLRSGRARSGSRGGRSS